MQCPQVLYVMLGFIVDHHTNFKISKDETCYGWYGEYDKVSLDANFYKISGTTTGNPVCI